MSDNKSFEQENQMNQARASDNSQPEQSRYQPGQNQAQDQQSPNPYCQQNWEQQSGTQYQQGPNPYYQQNQGQQYGGYNQQTYQQGPEQGQIPYGNVSYPTQTNSQQDGFAITSLILGILSLLFVFLGPYAFFGCLTGIAGIIFGVVSRKKRGSSAMGTAGLIMSSIAVGLCIIITIACVACTAAMFDFIADSY